MATKLEIFNMAIDQVGGTRMVLDTDTDTVEGKTLNTSWATIVDEVLSSKDWNFARWVESVAKTVDPEGLTRSVYAAPDDAVAVWQVGTDQFVENLDDWSYENGLIFITEGGPDPAFLRYTKRITDVTKFSPQFTSALIARFSSVLAMPVTRSQKMFDKMLGIYVSLLDLGGTINGLQGKHKKIRRGQNNLLAIRNLGA